MLQREMAWKRLCEWTRTELLRKHARAVEIVMRQAAYQYGAGDADVEKWGLAGMLHDADYEQWPQDHPRRTVKWLRAQGETDIAHTISAHYTKWGVPHESALDKALLACDELSGFIITACLVRPDGVTTLTPKSVRKKLKDKSFASRRPHSVRDRCLATVRRRTGHRHQGQGLMMLSGRVGSRMARSIPPPSPPCQRPLNTGGRFSMKAWADSRKSSVRCSRKPPV